MLKYGLPLAAGQAPKFLNQRIDQLLIAGMLSAEALGLYAVVTLIFTRLLYVGLPTGYWPGFYDFGNWVVVWSSTAPGDCFPRARSKKALSCC